MTAGVAEPLVDCYAFGVEPREECLHLNCCRDCAFGTSVKLGAEKRRAGGGLHRGGGGDGGAGAL
eukprot:6260167-Pyramimonas_sp.AAC.2